MSSSAKPTEIFEGFEITPCAGQFVASRRSGSGAQPSGAASSVLVASTLESLRTKIRQSAAVAALVAPSTDPVLIGEHHEYNLVSWNGWVYALPRAFGHVDIRQPSVRTRREVVSGPTAGWIRRALSPKQPDTTTLPGLPTLPPVPTNLVHSGDETATFIASRAGFTIVLFASKYFAIPESDGTFDIARMRASGYSVLFVGSTLQEVLRELDTAGHSVSSPGAQGAVATKTRVLVLAQRPAHEIRPLVETLRDHTVTILAAQHEIDGWKGYEVIPFRGADDRPAADLAPDNVSAGMLDELKHRGLDTVVLPYGSTWNWADPRLEHIAHRMSARLIALFDGGRRQIFKGQDIHRILYNKAYLASMFTVIPGVAGQRVIDVGCSDGLVCHMLLTDGPKSVTGIDVLKTVGCNYPDPRITYFNMNAQAMQFPDNSFDVSYSIATLEHVPEPIQVIKEMKRVTRPGGYCYVQAGPLYFSPFGHHMFGYFDEYPWIHLRKTPAEIVAYAKARGVDATIRHNLGRDTQDYVDDMLSRDHINGKTLAEYHLDEFSNRSDIELLKYVPSFEGENLLTPTILREVRGISKDVLIGHGFEIAFRVR